MDDTLGGNSTRPRDRKPISTMAAPKIPTAAAKHDNASLRTGLM
jgi:hypothetical protein